MKVCIIGFRSTDFRALPSLNFSCKADCAREILNNVHVWNNRVDDPFITIRECKKKVSDYDFVAN